MSNETPSITKISLFSTIAVKGALDSAVVPAYEKSSGVQVDHTFDSTIALLRRIEQGARPDVMVGTAESFEGLVSTGVIDGPSMTPIARTGVGIAVLRGEPKPDITTVEAMVNTLLNARSVAYSQSGASGVYFTQMVHKPGIADEITRRATVVEKGFVARAVVDGRADLAVQSLSELQSVPEVDIIGGLPETVQRYTVLCAGLGVHATEEPEAINLLRALAGDVAKAAYVCAGLEAPTSA